MLKRIIKGQLYFTSLSICLFFMLATGVHAVPVPDPDPDPCPIDPRGTYIEAEHFTGYYDHPDSDDRVQDRFTMVADTNALGGYVLVSGSSGATRTSPRNQVKKYKVRSPDLERQLQP